MNNRTYINSAELIPEIYSDYNIQSDDFVSRFPTWVVNALEELKLIQAYISKEVEIEYDDNKCFLPWDFKGVEDVIINNQKIPLLDKSKFNKDGYSKVIDNVITFTPNNFKVNNIVNTVETKDADIPTPISNPYYYINDNWLHTNIESGILKLKYKAIPTTFDHSLNMEMPLIYNIGMLRRYLKLYVIRQILIRGYKHPVLNLTANNPIINPGLELANIRSNVRVACNKFSTDRREVISNILRNTFNK